MALGQRGPNLEPALFGLYPWRTLHSQGTLGLLVVPADSPKSDLSWRQGPTKKEKDGGLPPDEGSHQGPTGPLRGPTAKDKEDWRLILKVVGKFVAAKTFITVTPQAAMNLPA